MSGKQAKRHRALERRVELLEVAGMGCAAETELEDARRAARTSRRREREARRREYIWRTIALAAVAAALIAAVLAAGVLRGAEPEEPEPAAVVCRWIGCSEQ